MASGSAGNANVSAGGLELAQSEKLAVENNVRYTYQVPKAAQDYQIKFNPDKAPIYVPVKTIIVKQDPAADQVVPAGTEVKVTLAAKGSLPVGSFQVGSGFQAKYGAADVDLVLKDLTEKGQTVVPILESEKTYEMLSQPERNAVVQYAQSVGLSAGTDAEAKSLYEDFQFFNNF